MNQVNANSNRILNFKATQQAQMQQNPQMQVEQPLPDVQIPQIYNVPEQSDQEDNKEKLKKMDMMGLVYPWVEHPALMLGTCAGLAWGVDKFSSACGGQYETSLVGKAARLGDDIQGSKLIQSKPVQTVLGWGRSAKNKLDHIFRNSDVINAIRKTPSSPEWNFVKGELHTMEQRVAEDFSRVVNKLVLSEAKDGAKFVRLTDLGIDKNDKEFIKKFFGGAAQTEEAVSNAVQLKRLGLTDDAIRQIINKPEASELVKAKYFEKLGIDEAFLQKLKKNPATKEDIAKIREACNKARGIKIGAGYQKWLGPFQPFARKIGLDEVGNRLTSMSEAKTKTGRAIATFLQKCHRGFTFGGGKMGVLFFVTPLLVETMLDVKKAEPDKKVGTAAHGLVHSVSWVFTFPLALSILHRFGGMKYAGMSKEAVEESRKLIKEFNEKANPYKERSFMQKIFGGGEKKAAGEFFETIGEYNAAKDKLTTRLKELKTVKNQSLLTKICKKIGSFITMDLECISSFKNGGFFGGGIKNITNKLKNIGGIPLRVGLWAALTMGVLDSFINKGIKGCFGNYYDRYKEEEFEENKKAQKAFLKEDLKSRLQDAQRQKVMGAVNKENNTFEPPQKLQESLKKEQLQAQVEEAIKAQETKLAKRTETEHKPEAEPATITKPVINNTKNVNQGVSNESTSQNLAEPDLPHENIVPKTEQMPTEEIKPAMKVNNTNTQIPNSKPVKAEHNNTVKRDNYTYIPSSENIIPKKKNETEVNKYIPSQLGAKFTKTFDNSGLEAALRRADRAEQRAIQTLAGNFNSY